jgi:hypothetical protein
MGSTLWRFSTTRMLHEYVERMYLPSPEERAAKVIADNAVEALKATAAEG